MAVAAAFAPACFGYYETSINNGVIESSGSFSSGVESSRGCSFSSTSESGFYSSHSNSYNVDKYGLVDTEKNSSVLSNSNIFTGRSSPSNGSGSIASNRNNTYSTASISTGNSSSALPNNNKVAATQQTTSAVISQAAAKTTQQSLAAMPSSTPGNQQTSAKNDITSTFSVSGTTKQSQNLSISAQYQQQATLLDSQKKTSAESLTKAVYAAINAEKTRKNAANLLYKATQALQTLNNNIKTAATIELPKFHYNAQKTNAITRNKTTSNTTEVLADQTAFSTQNLKTIENPGQSLKNFMRNLTPGYIPVIQQALLEQPVLLNVLNLVELMKMPPLPDALPTPQPAEPATEAKYDRTIFQSLIIDFFNKIEKIILPNIELNRSIYIHTQIQGNSVNYSKTGLSPPDETLLSYEISAVISALNNDSSTSSLISSVHEVRSTTVSPYHEPYHTEIAISSLLVKPLMTGIYMPGGIL